MIHIQKSTEQYCILYDDDTKDIKLYFLSKIGDILSYSDKLTLKTFDTENEMALELDRIKGILNWYTRTENRIKN